MNKKCDKKPKQNEQQLNTGKNKTQNTTNTVLTLHRKHKCKIWHFNVVIIKVDFIYAQGCLGCISISVEKS